MTTTSAQADPLAPLRSLLDEVQQLRARVDRLERQREVPAVVPLREFAAWYQAATGSPVPLVTESQLRSWVARRRHFAVDWIVRDGRSVLVDAAKFVEWRRRARRKVRVR